MEEKQSLYLVFGGKVKKIGIDCFKNPNELEVVGIFDNLKKAKEAWKAKSIRYIDDANKRYKVVPLFNILNPYEMIFDYLAKVDKLKIIKNYIKLKKNITLLETIYQLHQTKASAALIFENKKLLGIFTEKDIVKNISNNFKKKLDNPIENFMTVNVKTISPRKSVIQALETLKINGFRHLPVYDKNKKKFYGLISYKDFILSLMERKI